MKETVNFNTQISIRDLEHALKIAAKVVALYGEVYLPGFMRLKNEVMAAKQKNDAKAEALLIANMMADI